jgi:hypothetical protein
VRSFQKERKRRISSGCSLPDTTTGLPSPRLFFPDAPSAFTPEDLAGASNRSFPACAGFTYHFARTAQFAWRTRMNEMGKRMIIMSILFIPSKRLPLFPIDKENN